jgi:hypothetical protein
LLSSANEKKKLEGWSLNFGEELESSSLLNRRPVFPEIPLALEAPTIVSPNPISKSGDVNRDLWVDGVSPGRHTLCIKKKSRNQAVVQLRDPFHGTREVEMKLNHYDCDDVVPIITSSLLDIIREKVLVIPQY